MFKNTYQSGFVSILYAGGSSPLSIWGQQVMNGHIRRVTDEDVQSLALEIMGTNVATTYIICPAGKSQTLGIRLPFFIMIVKNMKKYFTFEITVLGSSYLETLRVQIHANIRIRRIYFSDRLYAEDEMPQEFKLYVPISTKGKGKGKGKEPKIAVEDKSIGADIARVSVVEAKEDEKIPAESGIPPTPLESPTAEGRAESEAAATEVTETEVVTEDEVTEPPETESEDVTEGGGTEGEANEEESPGEESPGDTAGEESSPAEEAGG